MNFKMLLSLLLLSTLSVIPVLAQRGSGHSGHSGGSHSSHSYGVSAHSHSEGNKPVHVGSYTTKKGTVVHSYNRSYPGTVTLPSSSSAAHTHPPSASTHSSGSATTHGHHNVTYPQTITLSSLGGRDSHGRIKRSTAAKDSFKRLHPCPSTGGGAGVCPGYVIDHITPLSKGGSDSPSNMQWQTVEAAKAKDKIERH